MFFQHRLFGLHLLDSAFIDSSISGSIDLQIELKSPNLPFFLLDSVDSQIRDKRHHLLWCQVTQEVGDDVGHVSTLLAPFLL